MDFDAFTRRARQLAAEMPPEVMEGIDVVDVHEDVMEDPHLPEVLLLGMCESTPLADPTGTEPLRSVIHIWYGSFVAMAERDPSFDIEAELEETLEHEVRHHVEDRAGAPDLRDEDDLFEAHARFRAGLDVPTGWYRRGDPLEAGLWAVDLDLFLELPLRRARFEALRGTRLALQVLDQPLEIDVPDDAAPEEIWTFQGEGLAEGEDDEDEADEEPPAGPVGDLHVIPVVR